ncbi:hypothetical protein CDAR_76011 [Caerostris darwini]|uniref:Maturase K n=1 Tax=Caerostris darwini TaxID=1538125 RepID=A0AAV4Q6L7_9ARAC|nr:hypothetical protein CDAR_76011 [Caerostris darwini]
MLSNFYEKLRKSATLPRENFFSVLHLLREWIRERIFPYSQQNKQNTAMQGLISLFFPITCIARLFSLSKSLNSSSLSYKMSKFFNSLSLKSAAFDIRQ